MSGNDHYVKVSFNSEMVRGMALWNFLVLSLRELMLYGDQMTSMKIILKLLSTAFTNFYLLYSFIIALNSFEEDFS